MREPAPLPLTPDAADLAAHIRTASATADGGGGAMRQRPDTILQQVDGRAPAAQRL